MLTQRQRPDAHSGRGRGLYANVDQSLLSGRGYVTALDQCGQYDVEPGQTTGSVYHIW